MSKFLRTCRTLLTAGFTSKAPGIPRTHPGIATLKTDVSVNESGNRTGRLELAVAYRAMARCGLHEGVDNHATLMVPAADGHGQVMLLIPYGTHWSRVTASRLIALNESNEVVEGKGKVQIEAAHIHRSVHDLRDDAKCVIHTHSPYATALSMMENGRLQMVHQNSLRFYRGVAYDDNYNGLATAMEEGRRTGNCLGKDNTVLFMKNHGVMVTGKTVAEAFDRIYFLERACMVQILAMSGNQPLSMISDSVAARTYDVIEKGNDEFSLDHFTGAMECILAETPDVAD